MRIMLSVPRSRVFLGFCSYAEDGRKGGRLDAQGYHGRIAKTLDRDMGRWKDEARDG